MDLARTSRSGVFASDRYKLSIHLVTTDELYDLETDPGELNNLIDSAEHAAIRNELHDKLLNWMNVSRDPFRGYYWGNRPWRPDFPETWKNAGHDAAAGERRIFAARTGLRYWLADDECDATEVKPISIRRETASLHFM